MKAIEPHIRSRWPWGLFMVIIVLTLVGAAFMYLGRSVTIETLWGFRGVPVVFAITYGLIGALILSHQPRNAIGWIFLWFGLISALDLLGEEYFTYSYYIASEPLPADEIAAWLSSWIWVLQAVPMLSFLPLLFPSGRLPSRRWRPVIIAALLVMLWMAFSVLLDPDLEARSSVIKNPFGLEYDAGVIFISLWMSLIVGIIISALGLASLFYRYRKGTILEKQQIKWLMYACIIALIFAIPALFGGKVGEYVFIIAALGIPVSVGISILYYRLFDIDLIIRRTLVYGLLTASLALVYFSGVVLMQSIFESVTRQQSTIAVIISTLAIAALFNPLRRRIQTAIDQRFFRQKYNADRIVEDFSARLRYEVDLDEISTHLLKVVEETLHPEHASLWIRPLRNQQSEHSPEDSS